MRPRPGDAFGSSAEGVQGVIIRHGTGSGIGHCGLVIQLLEEGPDPLWQTHEALGRRGPRGTSGVQVAQRRQSTMVELHSPLRTPAQVGAAISLSHALADASEGYDYAEVVRVGLYVLARGLDRLRLRPVSWLLDQLGKALHRRDDARRLFCSQHLWTVLTAVRPELAALSSQPADRIWPGEGFRALRVDLRDRLEATEKLTHVGM